jgi:murein DD-endopeptidase MepM/ murein hydrolase activator NlpD
MKYLVSFLSLLFSVAGFAQQQQQLRTKLYSEKNPNGYTVFADNDEFCPVSMMIDMELTNMSSTNGNHKVFVIPAKTKAFAITTLVVLKRNGGGGFKTKSQQNYGDATVLSPAPYIYSLPFPGGKAFTVDQGYNGNFSHQNENSLDFSMPIGTEVSASRGGIVVKTVDNNNQNCPDKSCAAYNNYILIYHNDGTFSQYVHLKQNGALVHEGDIVKENDIIGYSGDTGWANGPHLHFMVFIMRIDTRETLKTKFKINDGKESQYLKQRIEYRRYY